MKRPRNHQRARIQTQVRLRRVFLFLLTVTAFVIYAALHTGFGGKLGWGPMIKVFVAPIIAIVWYLGVAAYRRSQGISLTNTFREIPPE